MFVRQAFLKWRREVVALLVLCAVVLISSSRAQASCGDYVMVGGQHHLPQNSHQLSSDPLREHNLPQPKCHGPSCSNGAIPPATPVPRIEVTIDHWGLLGQSMRSPCVECQSFVVQGEDLPLAGLGLSILRPPR